MKSLALWGVVAVLAGSNGLALVHAARNRSGEPEAEITLTNKALASHWSKDDSGVALTMRVPTGRGPDRDMPWFGVEKLRELGFDVSVPASSVTAWQHYARQRARSGYLALEVSPDGGEEAAIDAGLDAAALRARHPDRRRVAVVRASFRAWYGGPWVATADRPARPARVGGAIEDMPLKLHVPLPYSAALRTALARGGEDATPYRLTVRYGRLLEPQVVGVEVAR